MHMIYKAENAVDLETEIISAAETDCEIKEVVADKGYRSEDSVDRLENEGICILRSRNPNARRTANGGTSQGGPSTLFAETVVTILIHEVVVSNAYGATGGADIRSFVRHRWSTPHLASRHRQSQEAILSAAMEFNLGESCAR